MSKRCQVCGGPVANGRCSLCGMPFRSDEVLYHLNENRRDHYKHASPKAKKIMRAQEIPEADRKTRETRERAKSAENAAGRKKSGSLFTRIAVVLVILISFAGPVAGKLTEWMKSAGTQDAAYREIVENGAYLGYLLPGQYLRVGEEIPEGSYAISIEEGYAEFIVTGYEAEKGTIRSEKITLDEDQPWVLTELENGQKVDYRFADLAETRLDFYQAP